MIEKLYIVKTEDTPEILLDAENHVFEISGRSLPENVNLFFLPLIEWFTNYFKHPLKETVLSINLEYFNSASAKKMVELLLILEKNIKKANKIKVVWYFKKYDFTMEKKGEELLSIFKIPYEITSL